VEYRVVDVNTLLEQANDPAQRPEVIKALEHILLSSDDGNALAYRQRRDAAQALSKIGHVDAINALILALQDHHAAVRAAAALALGTFNDLRVMDALVNALEDEAESVRIAALQSLNIFETLPYEIIIEHLADESDSVRHHAIDILKKAEKRAMPALLRAMLHPNSTVRGTVADLLGMLKDEATRATLKEAAKQDSSRWVRSRAEAALKQLPPEQFDYPRINRNNYPGLQTQNPIEQMRAQQSSKLVSPQTPAEIQKMLDQLDLRLLNGEISEETYKRLVARWEAKLKDSTD